MSKHTPGPWKANIAAYPKDEAFGFTVTASGKRPFVASAGVYAADSALVLGKEFRHLSFASEHFTPDEVIANVNLMAASPTMYDALVHVIGCIENGDGDMETVVRAALAEATKGTP